MTRHSTLCFFQGLPGFSLLNVTATNDVAKCLASLQAKTPFPVELVRQVEIPHARILEGLLLKAFELVRTKGKWIKVETDLVERALDVLLASFDIWRVEFCFGADPDHKPKKSQSGLHVITSPAIVPVTALVITHNGERWTCSFSGRCNQTWDITTSMRNMPQIWSRVANSGLHVTN